MARGLSILSILAAVMAALSALVLVQGTLAALLAPLLALAGAVLLFLERNNAGIVAGAAVTLLAIIGILANAGSISFGDSDPGSESEEVSFGIPESMGPWLGMVAGLAVVGGTVWSRWDALGAPWAQWTSATLPAAAALAGIINPGELVNQGAPLTLLTGLLCLAATLPGILLSRGD